MENEKAVASQGGIYFWLSLTVSHAMWEFKSTKLKKTMQPQQKQNNNSLHHSSPFYALLLSPHWENSDHSPTMMANITKPITPIMIIIWNTEETPVQASWVTWRMCWACRFCHIISLPAVLYDFLLIPKYLNLVTIPFDSWGTFYIP